MKTHPQIHSIQHYSLKKYQHPTYALCRSYGLVGKLEAPKAKAPKAAKAHLFVFVLRAIAASWTFLVVIQYLFFSVPELPGGFIDTDYAFNLWDVDYVGEIKVEWMRRWKQAALTLPYLIVGGVLVADMARASFVQLVIFAFM